MNIDNLKFDWPAKRLPVIIRANRFNFYSHNYSTEFLTHEYHALHFYLYEGKMRFNNDIELDIQPGDITISPAGTSTSYHTAEMSSHLCIHFGARYNDGLENQEPLELPLYFSIGRLSPQARSRFMEIIEFHNLANEREVAGYAAANALRQLLLWLFLQQKTQQNFVESLPAVERKLERIVDEIEYQLEEPINIVMLAKKIGISQNYLALMFRKKYGVTIQRYILNRRIENAKFMLEATDMQIKEIGTAAGFPNPQYFNKRFREITGVSPSEYRNKSI
jgi:AraC-like DNA-binding protein